VSERGFTFKQSEKVIYGGEKHRNSGNKEQNNRKVKGRKWGSKETKRACVATLSDLYPSTCLTWEALPGVLKVQSA